MSDDTRDRFEQLVFEADTPQPGRLPHSGVELSSFDEQIEVLGARYGYDGLKRHLREYSERIDRLAELNGKLFGMSPELDGKLYTDTIAVILAATQEYYAYIGAFEDDLKDFFQRIAGAGITNGLASDADDLRALAKLVSAPLFSMQAIRPDNYTMQIDAITNNLATLGAHSELNSGRIGVHQPIKTTVTLDMPEHVKIEGGNLSTYDKSIINGVTSLIESGNIAFSIPMLYHAMTGRPNPSIDDNLADEIAAKLEKMRTMLLTIDVTEEARAQLLKDLDGNPVETVEDVHINGYLMPLVRVSGVVNGKRTDVYQLMQTPPLYQYSKLKRQLATVPISLLGAPINNNSTTIPLKTYLLQRIEMMKNKRNSIKSRTILFSSIYEELGDAEAAKARKMRIRNYAKSILNYYITEGYIKGYNESKKGRELRGVEIIL